LKIKIDEKKQNNRDEKDVDFEKKINQETQQ
jgi:hypothetical protein